MKKYKDMKKKILLLQIREPGIDKIEADLIISQSGLPKEKFVFRNFLQENLVNLSVGEFSHVMMLGSSAVNISEGDLPWFAVARRIIRDCENKAIPFLGLCFGCQFLAYAYGAKLVKKETEVGAVEITTFGTPGTFWEFLPSKFLANEVHADYITDLPDSLANCGFSEMCPVQIIAHKNKPLFGTQFHPEHTRSSAEEFLKFYAGKYFQVGRNKEVLDKMLAENVPEIKNIIYKFLQL